MANYTRDLKMLANIFTLDELEQNQLNPEFLDAGKNIDVEVTNSKELNPQYHIIRSCPNSLQLQHENDQEEDPTG